MFQRCFYYFFCVPLSDWRRCGAPSTFYCSTFDFNICRPVPVKITLYTYYYCQVFFVECVLVLLFKFVCTECTYIWRYHIKFRARGDLLLRPFTHVKCSIIHFISFFVHGFSYIVDILYVTSTGHIWHAWFINLNIWFDSLDKRFTGEKC